MTQRLNRSSFFPARGLKITKKSIFGIKNRSYCSTSFTQPTMQQQNLQAIVKLVQQLVELDNVERVKAFATRFPDIHHIDFELELKPGNELSNEIWGKVQDLVIDCEWELRDDFG